MDFDLKSILDIPKKLVSGGGTYIGLALLIIYGGYWMATTPTDLKAFKVLFHIMAFLAYALALKCFYAAVFEHISKKNNSLPSDNSQEP